MQIKATRYHYVPTRMTKVKTTEKAKCKEGCGPRGSHVLMVEMENGTGTW